MSLTKHHLGEVERTKFLFLTVDGPRVGRSHMRRLSIISVLLQLAGVVALGSASAQEISPTSDASRLQDLLLERQFAADVCVRDLNGDGVEDCLIVLTGVFEGEYGPSVPMGPDEDLTDSEEFQRGAAKAVFTVVALDGVLELKKESQDWQAELVYVLAFDELYEFPLPEIAHCEGDVEDRDYRMCLMKGFFNRERTDAYPTLPSCSQNKMP
jgi:hypothetical protein